MRDCDEEHKSMAVGVVLADLMHLGLTEAGQAVQQVTDEAHMLQEGLAVRVCKGVQCIQGGCHFTCLARSQVPV